MGVNIGSTKVCLQLQQSANDIARGNVPSLKIENFGFLQWLTSSQNTSGFQSVGLQSPDGKNLTVRVEYWQNPRTAASTGTEFPNICSTGSTIGKKYADINITYHTTYKVTLNEAEFRDLCDAGVKGSAFAQDLTQMAINQILTKIDTDAVNYTNSHAGNFYGSIAGPKTVALYRNDGTPFQGGVTTIASDYQDIGGVGTPAAIGTGYLRSMVYEMQNYACCSQYGIDMGRGNSPFIFFSDLRVDQNINPDNNFFVLAPGALQLITRTRWVGQYEDMRVEDQVKSTMVLPVPGGGSIPVDFTIYRDFCGSSNDGQTSYVLTWTAHYDFWNIPSDNESVGSPYRSVNGILAYRATCANVGCGNVNS